MNGAARMLTDPGLSAGFWPSTDYLLWIQMSKPLAGASRRLWTNFSNQWANFSLGHNVSTDVFANWTAPGQNAAAPGDQKAACSDMTPPHDTISTVYVVVWRAQVGSAGFSTC